MPSEQDRRPGRGPGMPLRTLQTVWIVFIVGVVIYGIVAWVARPVPPTPENRTITDWLADPLVLALHAAGILALILGIFVPRSIARRRPAPPAVPARSVSAFDVAPAVVQAFVVRYALFETAAVLGLVAALLSREPSLYLPLGVVALAALFFASPSEGAIRGMDELHRQS